jgi:hypothetical protein
MLAASSVMVVGVFVTAVLSQREGFRLGGVMVVPLLAVYTLRELFSPLVFVVATAAAWVALHLVREYTLTHGRRVFLVSVVVGAAASILTAFVLDGIVGVGLGYRDAEVVGSIFPGVAAYNLMRVDRERRLADLAGMAVGFCALLALGVLAMFGAAALDTGLPPVLLLPTTDAVALLGLPGVGAPSPRIVPGWLSAALLLADVAVYEWVRSRYDLRLAGIILVPLLAFFSARYAATAAIYVLGATLTFLAITIVHWLTLLYGRNLLAFALVSGLSYSLAIGRYVPDRAPGIVVFFLGLLVGIGAYNLHRVAPRNRAANLRLSAGLFAVLYLVVATVSTVPHGGLAHEPTAVHWGALAVALGLAGLELVRLERSRPDGAAFAAASVFAADGAAADSPLATGERRPWLPDGLPFGGGEE